MRIAILILLLLPACVSQNRETSYTRELEQRFQCKVLLEEDHEAVKDGELRIELQNSKMELCNADSVRLKKLATDIAANLLKVVEHKEVYKTVEVSFYFYHEVSSTLRERLCNKRMLVSADNPSQVSILEYTTPR